MASKKKRSSGFLWGLIIGVIVAVGAIYYYNNNSKSDFEKGSKKIERKAKKELNKAEDGVKKIFEK